jgi:hypothetical protein
LDRGGLGAKAEIEITAKPYEQIFEAMEAGGSRAEYRRSIGIEDEPKLIPNDAQAALAALPADDESGSPSDSAPPHSRRHNRARR